MRGRRAPRALEVEGRSSPIAARPFRSFLLTTASLLAWKRRVSILRRETFSSWVTQRAPVPFPPKTRSPWYAAPRRLARSSNCQNWCSRTPSTVASLLARLRCGSPKSLCAQFQATRYAQVRAEQRRRCRAVALLRRLPRGEEVRDQVGHLGAPQRGPGDVDLGHHLLHLRAVVPHRGDDLQR